LRRRIEIREARENLGEALRRTGIGNSAGEGPDVEERRVDLSRAVAQPEPAKRREKLGKDGDARAGNGAIDPPPDGESSPMLNGAKCDVSAEQQTPRRRDLPAPLSPGESGGKRDRREAGQHRV